MRNSRCSGGAAGTVASVTTALNVFAKGNNLDPAMDAPRLFTMGQNLPLLYESSMEAETINSLSGDFPVMVEVDRLASVNAIYCRNGKVPNCISRHDPRGYGLSLIEN